MRNSLQTESALTSAFAACRGAFVSTGIFSFIINLLMLTGPLFMLQVYDRVLASRSIPTLVALTLLIAGLFAFLGILELLRSRVLSRIGQRVEAELGSHIFEATIRLGLNRGPGAKAEPLRDLDTIRQFLSGPGPFALFDIPWTPVYIGVIYLMHTWLGILATIGALILLAFAIINEILTREPSADAGRQSMMAHAFADESRRNAEVIEAMGMLSAVRGRWRSLQGEASAKQIKSSDRAGTISSFSKAVRLFLQSAMLALGAYLAVFQEITPGTMIAASIIMSRALSPLDQAIAHWRGFLSFRRANGRLGLILQGLETFEARMTLPEPRGELEVEGLTIVAPGQSSPLLQGIGFSLQPGDALGVLGPTGAGKSTLARALIGVWPPTKGSVNIDGATLDQWDKEQLGAHVGYLPQDVELFAGTVAENIARFVADASSEDIVTAARQANVHELILKLSNGYNTKIGEGGAILSAGQRQRIALARALYGNPVFVVLDEPNSNLDAEGEAALVEAIKTLKARDVTVVVIAHRPSAISAVDQILFLKEGHQAAFGPRDEVLASVLRASSNSGNTKALSNQPG